MAQLFRDVVDRDVLPEQERSISVPEAVRIEASGDLFWLRREGAVACGRGALGSREPTRQRELWSSLLADVEEWRELEEGYALKLPAARLADVAELMDIERRCCSFLQLRLVAEAGTEVSETHIWFTLSGPPGSKRVLDAELELMLDSSRRSP